MSSAFVAILVIGAVRFRCPSLPTSAMTSASCVAPHNNASSAVMSPGYIWLVTANDKWVRGRGVGVLTVNVKETGSGCFDHGITEFSQPCFVL